MNSELNAIVQQAGRVISGKENVIGKIVTVMLAGGHILLDDVPGVGKTTLAVSLGKALGMTCRRVQFTPDVLPSDIVGYSIYNKATGSFDYMPGVVNGANILLGDEINRTSSRTQSALLEAMEENQVTVDGKSYPLCDPFLVIATQNNVGSAGTQPLPYAQMDRFMARLTIGYPDHEAQMELLKRRQNADPAKTVEQVTSLDRFRQMQADVQAVSAKDSVLDYISRLVIATRTHPAAETGVSPRGLLFIDRMAKANAYRENRDYVIPEDVRNVFADVCTHRLILNGKARMNGTTAEQVIADILKSERVPDRMGRA